MTKIYIVIVTYNGMRWLQKTLALIPEEYEIVVIDNNSSDETVRFIKNGYPKIDLIPQNRNLGFGGANNLGIQYAYKKKADYFFLLNQDAYLRGNTIEKLIETHKKNNDYGILSPIHLNGIGNKLDRNFSNYLRYDNNDTFYFDAITSRLKDIYEVPFVNAAAWLLPKKTLDVVGGFDPIFFHYGEDDNYCQRVLFHRLKIGIVTNSFIMHDRDHSLKQPSVIFSNQYFDEMEKNYKCKFANVNYEDWENDLENELFKLKKLEIRSFIFLKFSRVKGYRRQINLLKRISLETRKSRRNNQLIKSNYLNL